MIDVRLCLLSNKCWRDESVSNRVSMFRRLLTVARQLAALAILSATLHAQPMSPKAQSPTIQEQIKQHELKLGQARSLKDGRVEGAELFDLGTLYARLGDEDKALANYNLALSVFKSYRLVNYEAITLHNLGTFYLDRYEFEMGFGYFKEELTLRQSSKDVRGEATLLKFMGLTYSNAGNQKKALELQTTALSAFKKINDQFGQAVTLNDLGLSHERLGQRQEAIKYYKEALPIEIELKNGKEETTTLGNLVSSYVGSGQRDEALKCLERMLQIKRDSKDSNGADSITRGIAGTLIHLGQYDKAQSLFDELIAKCRAELNVSCEANVLRQMGRTYTYAGKFFEALESLTQAISLYHKAGDRRSEAIASYWIANTYYRAGDNRSAVHSAEQSLDFWHETKQIGWQASVLSNESTYFSQLGQFQRALNCGRAALNFWRRTNNVFAQSGTLHTIGWIYNDMGSYREAIPYFSQALSLSASPGNQLESLRGIGVAYDHIGQKDSALASEMASLSIAQTLDDPDAEGDSYSSLMMYWRGQGVRETAILFGLDAVNAYQGIRRELSGQDDDTQAGYTKLKAPTYRVLAELLVQEDRLAEAEQVLDLLKEQELKDTVRGSVEDPAAKLNPVSLTPAQQRAQTGLSVPEKKALALVDTSIDYAALQAKLSRTAEEDARLRSDETRIEAGNAEVSESFKAIYRELAPQVGVADANALLSKQKSDLSLLQNTLAQFGPRILGIRLLLGEDHAYALLITANSRHKIVLKATPAELRAKALEVRDDLRSPASDPKPHLAELYAMLISPLGPELAALEAQPNPPAGQPPVPTLLWSLDGVLRYVPMAALYDGSHYMAERFNNVLFTPESYGHMVTAPASVSGARPHVLAMGLSKSYGGLPALPGVMPELEAVVHDPAVPTSHGPMEGRLLPNEQFTLEALKTHLGSGGAYPVVHIASHFVVQTGAGHEEPFLMLGSEGSAIPNAATAQDPAVASANSANTTGYQLTLSELENSPITFHGTRLLTLSACNTAAGAKAKDGLEMDSLGMIAQQKDAEAVLASLWSVNDISTSWLMSDFYASWLRTPAAGKAEAVRQAQLGFLRRTSPAAPHDPSTAQALAHPFYWAPFVLVGNFE